MLRDYNRLDIKMMKRKLQLLICFISV